MRRGETYRMAETTSRLVRSAESPVNASGPSGGFLGRITGIISLLATNGMLLVFGAWRQDQGPLNHAGGAGHASFVGQLVDLLDLLFSRRDGRTKINYANLKSGRIAMDIPKRLGWAWPQPGRRPHGALRGPARSLVPALPSDRSSHSARAAGITQSSESAPWWRARDP
jgi:hypothetical protein